MLTQAEVMGPRLRGDDEFNTGRDHAPLRPPQRHDQGRAQSRARLKRDFGEVETAGVAKGAGRFRHGGPARRGELLRGADQGAAGLRLPGRGGRRLRGHRQDPHLDRRPARRHHQFPARHPAFRGQIALEREGTIVAGLTYNPANDDSTGPSTARAPSSTTSACASPPAASSTNACWPAAFPCRPRRPRASLKEMIKCSRGSPASAASAQPRWTWPRSRPAASTATGSATFSPGTWRPAPHGPRGRRQRHQHRRRRATH